MYKCLLLQLVVGAVAVNRLAVVFRSPYSLNVVQALYQHVPPLPDASSSASIGSSTLEGLKLLFVALESVRPMHPIPLPPPSPNAVPLERMCGVRIKSSGRQLLLSFSWQSCLFSVSLLVSFC